VQVRTRDDTTIPSGVVIPLVQPGGPEQAMEPAWVPDDDWQRWAVAVGHPDVAAACSAFRGLWLKRQMQGKSGPATRREWWLRFSGWIIDDVSQGRYNGQRDAVSGRKLSDDEARKLGLAAARAACDAERMASG
jgi:hypothetical protein